MTSAEWLCNEWLYLDQQFDMCLIDRNIYWDKLRQIQEQAKEMEKEQMIEFACDVYDKYNFGPQEISFREECEQFKSE
jgi:hypothetical protein